MGRHLDHLRDGLWEIYHEEGLDKYFGSPYGNGLPLHTSDLPSLTSSSSWSSFFSRSTSNDSLAKVLPEVDQTHEDNAEIASAGETAKVAFSKDNGIVMAAPPKGRKLGPAKGYERYNPERYRCTGYEIKDYKWLDGVGKAEDQRFSIDLEDGSMDRLPDVRPFLYYIGYHAGDRSRLPRNSDRHLSEVIEDLFVTAGREYLLSEWKKGNGYFLRDGREFYRVNEDEFETMPYAPYCNGRIPALKGDVGFDCVRLKRVKAGDVYQSVGFMPKSNIRVPLPLKSVTKVGPGHQEWDHFIQHLYGKSHPMRLIGFFNYSVNSVHHARVRDEGRRFVTNGALKVYPFDPKCPVPKTVSCNVQ